MKYLRGTIDYVIEYSAFLIVLEGYNDDNWISDLDEKNFTSSYVFTFRGGVVTWRSADKQLFQDQQWNQSLLLLK